MMPDITTTRLFLMEVAKPRPAFLLGPKSALQKAQTLRALPQSKPACITFPHVGNIEVFKMQIGDETIFEIEAATAVEVIQQLGLKLGEEGLALDFVDGA